MQCEHAVDLRDYSIKIGCYYHLLSFHLIHFASFNCIFIELLLTHLRRRATQAISLVFRCFVLHSSLFYMLIFITVCYCCSLLLINWSVSTVSLVRRAKRHFGAYTQVVRGHYFFRTHSRKCITINFNDQYNQ